MTDKQLEYAKSQCSANKRLEFRNAVPVSLRSRFKNEDYTALDLVFSEKIHMRFFDPERSVVDRIRQYNIFTALCQCVGADFLDIPPCPGGWEDFVIELTSLLARHKYILLYAKITVNEEGRIVPGTGKCFSLEPDMEYSDEDLRFLDAEDTYRPENRVEVVDLPDTPRNTKEFEEAIAEKPKRLPPAKFVNLDTISDPMRPNEDISPFEEVPKSVFDEYLAEHEKPAWVADEVEKHKPKAKPRGKKREPVSLELNKEGLEDIEIDSLPF
jgi:hypothetical protein